MGLTGGYFFRESFLERASLEQQVLSQQVVNDPTLIPHIQPAEPVMIKIPLLNVEAHVEHVGKDSQGRMDVPRDYLNTAWYGLGSMPGEIGNAVIAGHLDTPTGDPSVFFNIDTLSIGDEIISIDKKGQEFVFHVTDVVTYDVDAFPIKTVFGDYTKARLNLITCSGVFDSNSENGYSERVVVFSEFVEIR